RSAQTVLWRGLDMLVRLFAPLLPFTTEEVWAAMNAAGLSSDSRSVHVQTFVDAAPLAGSGEEPRWGRLLFWRDEVLKALEGARQEKRIGTGLEARIELLAPS